MVKLVMTYIGILVGLFVAQHFLSFNLSGILTYLEASAVILVAVFVLRGFKL